MAVYNWSALINNQQIVFNPATDKLTFDSLAISAGSVDVRWTDTTSILFGYAGKNVTLAADIRTITSSNVSFANGSLLIVGDNSTGVTGDNGDNLINGSSNEDQFIGLGGNDTINGGAGSDRYLVREDWKGNVVITDTGGTNDTVVFYHNTEWNSATNTMPYRTDMSRDASGANIIATTYKNEFLDHTIVMINQFNSDSVIGIETLTTRGEYPGGYVSSFDNTLTGSLTGTVNADLIVGKVVGELINGAAGDDDIQGGDGNDTIYGGDGSDGISGGNGNDIIYSGAGNDDCFGGSGDDTIYTTSDPTLTWTWEEAWGDAGNDRLVGGDGNDGLSGGDGNDTLEGGAGTDGLNGGAGDDVLIGGTGNDTINGSDGVDTAQFSSTRSASTVVKNADGSYTISSTADGSDTLTNIEYAQFADQSLTLTIGNSYNWSTLANNQQIAFNPSTDKLTFDSSTISAASLSLSWVSNTSTSIAYSGKSVTLLTDVKALTTTNVTFANGSLLVVGDNATATVADDSNNNLTGSAQADLLLGLGGDDQLNGGAGSDFIDGGAGPNGLFGAAGNDTLIGGAGQDYLIGGSGNDSMNGGDGTDTVDYGDNGYDSAGVSASGVNVNLLTGIAIDNWGGTDSLVNIEMVNGSNLADRITGDVNGNMINGYGGNDSIDGGAGNDWLIGQAGDDLLIGGAGGDLFTGGSGNDTINGGEGPDTVQYSYSGYSGAESPSIGIRVNLQTGIAIDSWGGTDTLIDIEHVNGSILDDQITGNSYDNQLNGDAGNDTLDGASGNDRLIGGSGNDNLEGGGGVDTACFDATFASSGITKNPDGSYTIVSATDGTDTLHNIEYAQFSDQNVALISGALYNWSSLTNNQQIAFNAAIDKLSFDSSAISAASLSLNWVSNTSTSFAYSGKSITLQTDVKALTATNVTFANGSLLVVGDDANNTLRGSAYADYISGLGGDDGLDGGGGNDFIDGGANGQFGDGISFSGATVGVNVNLTLGRAEDGQGGVDTIQNIEHVTGTQYADTFIGNAATNWFSPGAGNDYVDGGSNTDVVFYEDATAAVNVNLITGIASGPTIGTDTLLSIEAIHGSKFSDVIQLSNNGGYVFARGGNDTITGGNGDDNIIPGSGNDVINGGNGRDHVDYGDDNNDALGAPTSGVNVNLLTGVAIDNWGGTDALISIENIGGSSFGDKITGDGTDNKISGNAGDDSLDGGSGNDWILGGSGNDLLLGSSGDDWIIGGTGNDSIDGGSGQNTAGYILGKANVSDLSGISLIKGAGQIWTLSSGGSNWFAVSLQSPTSNTLTITDLRSVSQIAIDGEIFGSDTLNSIQNLGFDASYIDASNNIQGFRAFNINISGTGSSLALTLANKTIIGTPGNDILTGSSGDETIIGLGGSDIVRAGAGNDTIDEIGNLLGSSIDGGLGWDNVTIHPDGTPVTLESNVIGIENFNIAGDNSTSLQSVVLKNAAYSAGENNNIGFNAWSGVFKIDAGAVTVGTVNIATNSGNDILIGGLGNDDFNGRGGNDTIDGGAGANVARYILGRTTATDLSSVALVKGAGQSWAISSGGANWFTISQQSTSSNSLTITDLRSPSQIALDGEASGVDILNNIQTLGFDASYLNASNDSQGFRAFNINISGTGSSLALTLANKTIIGTPGNDVLTGTAADDLIMGLGGADTISAGAGSDQIDEVGNLVGSRIDGGAGADQLTIHANGLDILLDTNVNGIERFNINAPNSASLQKVTITNIAFGGIQGIEIEVDSWNGQFNFDAKAVTAGNMNVYTGSYNDSLRGGSGDDQLQGEGGDDTFTGGPGNDRIDGGDGVDTAAFSGSKADYSLRSGGGKLYFISDLRTGSPDGSDIITNIEYLRFTDVVTDLSWASPSPVSSVQVNINTSLNGYNMFGSPSLDDLTGSHGDSTGSVGGPTFKFTSYDPVTRAFHVELYNPFAPTPNYSVGGASFYSQPFVSSGAMITGYISSGGPALPGAVNEIIGMTPFISWLMSSANVFLTEFKDVAFGSSDGVSLNGNNFVFDTVSGMNIDARTMLSEGLPAVLSGGDSISGGVGNDFLYGYGGDDTINGGAGSDTVVYSGPKSDYVVTAQSDGSYTIKDDVVGRDGTDKIFNVELAQFSDQTVNLPANIGLFGLHGIDYFWKADANGKHALLSGVNVTATVAGQPPEGANAPILFKNITWDAAGHGTAEVWGHASSSYENFTANLHVTGASSVAFASTLDASKWTVFANTPVGSNNSIKVGGYTADTTAALAAGDTKLGTVSFECGAATQVGLVLDFGQAGQVNGGSYGQALAHGMSDASGHYDVTGINAGSYALSGIRSVSDIGNAVTSFDALAALKIAVGINPNASLNGVQLALSPFQVMSADVVGTDGRVTSADALAILKMSVGMPTAPAMEWMFVEETRDLSGITRTSAAWDHTINVNVQGDTTVNLAGFIKGDVNGSWAPPSGTQYVETGDLSHFTNLSNIFHIPLSEWGVL